METRRRLPGVHQNDVDIAIERFQPSVCLCAISGPLALLGGITVPLSGPRRLLVIRQLQVGWH